MYSNIETVESDDVFASAMEEENIVENPFVQDSDGEPLHALDAARRLLGNEEDEEPSLSSSLTNSNANVGMGNSLLERIQQQKKQQNTSHGSSSMNTSTVNMEPYAASQINTATAMEQANASGDHEFGYPMVAEGSYSTSASANNVHIPQYSQVPTPNPYNTDSAYNSNQDIGDYKDTMMNVLSAVGSAAGTVATSAYHGTKTIYNTMAKSNNGNVGGGMAEMDYQRESLLMDPHDLEDQATMTTDSVSSAPNMTQSSSPTGMRAGVIRHSTREEGNSFVIFAKQFAVDMKDLFLGASRRVQIGLIALIVFIIWLIFFE